MERLTRKTEEEFAKNNGIHYLANATSKKVLNKLGSYEDAEEQGLLLRLPCKVGDTVYSPTRNFISEYTIESIEVYKEGLFFNWHCDDGIYINVCGFSQESLGKTVFLTKEEAEQALAKMKEV